jgi:hypothetical protein
VVVLAEEHQGHLEAGGKDHGLVDVALAGGAVAEVHNRRGVGTVVLDSHGVPGGVQRLRADDDLRDGHVDRVRVPAAGGSAAPDTQDVRQVHPAAVGHAVLAVAGKNKVVIPQGPHGSHLRGLLAQERRPEAQFALALQRGGLFVDPPDHHQVLVERAQLLV